MPVDFCVCNRVRELDLNALVRLVICCGHVGFILLNRLKCKALHPNASLIQPTRLPRVSKATPHQGLSSMRYSIIVQHITYTGA